MFEPCEECVKKHLSAALAYATDIDLDMRIGSLKFDRGYVRESIEAHVSRAWVLLNECQFFPRHQELANGFLVRAEELSRALDSWETIGCRIRDIRQASVSGTMTPMEVAKSLVDLPLGLVEPILGHFLEAAREGGNFVIPNFFKTDYIVDVASDVLSAARTKSVEEKGGESSMACAKKCATKGGKTAKVEAKKPVKAEKAPAKATKAAAKGGKTCKGCKK